MLIAIDGGSWANARGFGRFARELVQALAAARGARRLALLTDPRTARRGDFPAGVDVVEVDVRVPPNEAAAADGARSLRDLWAFRRACARLNPDLVFFPAVYSYFPVAGRTPTVVAFHDAIAEKLPHLIFPTRRGRFFWKLKCAAAVRRARKIVTVSEASRRDVAEVHGLRADDLLVIPEGVNRAVFHPTRDPAESAAERVHLGISPTTRVLLSVGGLSPHKNLDRFIAAAAALVRARRDLDLHLVFVGGGKEDVFHSDRDRLRALTDAEGLTSRTTFTGYVPDERLGALYRLADALVFPSLLEGFGLPALEAMACATAVVASRNGSLPEVAGDAGFYFDATSTEDLTRALANALDDDALRRTRAGVGFERSKLYTWERAAELLFAEFASLARRTADEGTAGFRHDG